MQRFGKWCLVVTAVLVMSAPAFAQRRGGRGFGGGSGSSLMLLSQKSVQEDLKLSEDQVKKLTEFRTKQREGFQGIRNLSEEERKKKFEEMSQESKKIVADTLQAEQVKRLDQIRLQQQGSRALSDPKVAETLGITTEQKDKLKAIQEETGKAMRELFQPGGNRDEARKKMEELRKSSREKTDGLLTADQQTKLKEMKGEPFKGELRFGGFGGRRGNRPRPNN